MTRPGASKIKTDLTSIPHARRWPRGGDMRRYPYQRFLQFDLTLLEAAFEPGAGDRHPENECQIGG
jgi:hypothetical protein